jgi:hypothetical protein
LLEPVGKIDRISVARVGIDDLGPGRLRQPMVSASFRDLVEAVTVFGRFDDDRSDPVEDRAAALAECAKANDERDAPEPHDLIP